MTTDQENRIREEHSIFIGQRCPKHIDAFPDECGCDIDWWLTKMKEQIEIAVMENRKKIVREFVKELTTPTCMTDTGICTDKITYDGIEYRAEKFLSTSPKE